MATEELCRSACCLEDLLPEARIVDGKDTGCGRGLDNDKIEITAPA